jgi:hypothetical protein
MTNQSLSQIGTGTTDEDCVAVTLIDGLADGDTDGVGDRDTDTDAVGVCDAVLLAVALILMVDVALLLTLAVTDDESVLLAVTLLLALADDDCEAVLLADALLLTLAVTLPLALEVSLDDAVMLAVTLPLTLHVALSDAVAVCDGYTQLRSHRYELISLLLLHELSFTYIVPETDVVCAQSSSLLKQLGSPLFQKPIPWFANSHDVFIATFSHAQLLHDVDVQHVGVRRPIQVFDENERT